jgi:hypothetical protein
VVDTFVRAIETSDFERRLQLVEASGSDHPGTVAGMYGVGPGWVLQPIGEILLQIRRTWAKRENR